MNRKIKTSSGKVLKEESAAGVRGILIRTPSPEKYLFRVYYSDGNFDDYYLRHSDLAVTIDADYEASFYENEQGEKFLDHSPGTLGWEVVDSNE